MKATPLALPEVLLLEPRVFRDDRGYFFEAWSSRTWEALGRSVSFVQDNTSVSKKGVLRGLHLQHPHDQGKLVTALTGRIWDVAVDLRVGSPRFGRWIAEELSAENHRQLYVPPGFGHGFCTLSEEAVVSYKCTAHYEPKSELSVRFDDPDLAIPWPIPEPLLSPKDGAAPRLDELVAAARLPRFESS